MREERRDVVVVGAGPAGSVTARRLAECGLDVLMIERNQEIGVPVRCAEGVNRGIEDIVHLDRRCISASVRGARIYSPDGTAVEVESARERVVGYVLERRMFDRFLAAEAANAGADVWVKTAATGVMKDDNGCVCGVYARHMNETIRIRADVVVGADGVESKIGEWAGMHTKLRMRDMAICAEFMMSGVEIDDEYCEFFIGNFAPRGYAWVFPKGDGCANVGLGIGADVSADNRRAYDYLTQFVESRFPSGKVIAEMYGAVPLSGPVYETVSDGVVLVGDAARQVNPISGGGITYAMRAALIAADAISHAFEAKDFSKQQLLEYERRWRKEFGHHLEIGLKAKEYFLKMPASRMNKLAHSIAARGPVKLKNLNSVSMLKEFIKRSPSILIDLARIMTLMSERKWK